MDEEIHNSRLDRQQFDRVFGENIKQGYFGGYDSSQVRNVNRDPDTEYATQLSIWIDNDMMVLDTTLIS